MCSWRIEYTVHMKIRFPSTSEYYVKWWDNMDASCFLESWHLICHAKPKGSIWLLYKWTYTAFWSCRAVMYQLTLQANSYSCSPPPNTILLSMSMRSKTVLQYELNIRWTTSNVILIPPCCTGPQMTCIFIIRCSSTITTFVGLYVFLWSHRNA